MHTDHNHSPTPAPARARLADAAGPGWLRPLAWSLLLLPGLSHAQDAASAESRGLQQCRQLREATARLACYDALPLPQPVSGALASQPPASATPSAAKAAALPPGATAVVDGAAASRADANFGLPAKASEQAETVQSSLARDLDGWGPTTVFVLSNGQRWQVADGSQGVLVPENRRVTVRRAALGTFVMEFEGLNRAPRVKRLQ